MFIASRGLREVKGKHEPMGDPIATELLKALSRKIWTQTLLWTAVFTAVAYVIPL